MKKDNQTCKQEPHKRYITMSVKEKKVLIIDNEEVIRESCKIVLERDGYIVDLAETGEKGIELFKKHLHDVVLLDFMLSGISGMEVMKKLNEIDPHSIKIVITGYASVPVAVEVMKLGANDFVPKPFIPETIRTAVNRGFEKRLLFLENEALKEEQEQIRRNMISLVSHELRSPLAATVQFLEIIDRGMAGEISEQSQEMVSRCVVRLREMLALIRKWLNLSTFDPKVMHKNFEVLDIREIAEKAVEQYRDKAKEMDIEISLEIDKQPLLINGFIPLITEIFSNLMSNAIKYNVKGGRLKLVLSKNGEYIQSEISDTGIGIPEEHVPRIFDEFYRVDGRRNGPVKGSGLGLAIVKKMVEFHNGEIHVESTFGKGTRFVFSIPSAR